MQNYCILVTGIPASGKSTIAEYLAKELCLPCFSKDAFKEILFDTVGFCSREEKVALGVAAMEIMYDTAERLMRRGLPFILENNFENTSMTQLKRLLKQYRYIAVTVTLTGDYRTIYRRFLARNASPDRHRGHVVNDRYPEEGQKSEPPQIPFETFVAGITARGMDAFAVNGPQIVVDTTDFQAVDKAALVRQIKELGKTFQSA